MFDLAVSVICWNEVVWAPAVSFQSPVSCECQGSEEYPEMSAWELSPSEPYEMHQPYFHKQTPQHLTATRERRRGKLTFNILTLRCYIIFSFFTYRFAEAENLLSFQPVRNQISFTWLVMWCLGGNPPTVRYTERTMMWDSKEMILRVTA